MPAAALAGMSTVTENEQLAPAARLTPFIDSVEVPVMVEPEPQKLLAGSDVAAKPDNVAFRSLVKFKSVISVRSKFEIL